ncbi:MAG: preprotein translocase subunit SecE [Holosporales bacterium]|jgi:preprotein translocase subunit SecE|nr:preprotein translocase subunit SecE [Holosporales bacterium]
MKVGVFFSEVRQEIGRVVWPSKKETWGTTVSVMVFVFSAALYFILTDTIIYTFFKKLLGM